MKAKNILFLLLLATISLFLSSCTALNHPSRSSPSFALLSDSSSDGSKAAFRLNGKLPIGVQVRLLEKNFSETCLAETKTHIQDISNPERIYTELETLDCRSQQDYSIAVLGGVLTSYEVVRGKEIKDTRISDMLDEKVRGTPVLSGLAGKAQEKRLSDGEWSLYGVKPRVLKIQFQGAQVLVAVYDLKESAGPRAFFFKNTIHSFTGWCSLPFIRTFLLNGTPYFESGSKCCDCGIVIQEIYKVGEKGVELIHAETVKTR